MTTAFTQQVKMDSLGGGGIHRQVLYDASRIAQLSEALFVPPASANIAVDANTTGRAQVVVHDYEGRRLVSKHYHRGGMVAVLLGDRYLGRRAERSRAFREWCLLSAMKQQGLPVPTPIAASRIQSGLWYRADLVTEYLPDTQTLADGLRAQTLERVVWQQIGVVIRRFHRHNVCHADLNARNILLASTGDVFLIDFDKSGFRKTGRHWRKANLNRLRRSLEKFATREPVFHFSEADWQALMRGYEQ